MAAVMIVVMTVLMTADMPAVVADLTGVMTEVIIEVTTAVMPEIRLSGFFNRFESRFEDTAQVCSLNENIDAIGQSLGTFGCGQLDSVESRHTNHSSLSIQSDVLSHVHGHRSSIKIQKKFEKDAVTMDAYFMSSS
jgi:hypothetical protein